MIKSIAVVLFAVALSCHAGFDQYTGKNYTVLLNPSYMADSTSPVTNSATTGVDVMGLQGNGAVVLSYKCDNAAGAILKFQIKSSSTTNGTYAVYTNLLGESSWSFTNTVGSSKVLMKPNEASRYLRVFVTPTVVTNGVAGAVLVTE